ncbi:MAG: ABC transporter permease [Bacteroidetes bacterium]|nr:ABC transporter permease [Bacteroidota bacterium]MBS1930942.1 ABC transporter permease [Bacteroidota bacterium]
MIKNYFKVTFRNLWKKKTYSFLNIFGLAVGIACAALIFLWVENELNFNHYFSNRDNLYIVKDQQTYDGTTFTFDATPGPLAQGIKAEIPGIKNTARCTWGDQLLFSIGDKNIYDQGNYVDAPFLSMFQLQFIAGNASTAFGQLNSLVVNETMAKKFFGTTDVLGKTLKVNNRQDYIITGVIKDLPKNVSFRFSWLAPFKIYEENKAWLKEWGNNGIITYVETEPKANITAINKKLHGYIQTKSEEAIAKMSIYPMNRWRLWNNFDTNGNEKEGNLKHVNLFSLIAWIILIIACINFMNLATARSEQRAREVGVRKVLGAVKRKLIGQFIAEALFMSLLATLCALVIITLTLPAFNSLVEKQLSLNIFQPSHISALLIITILCGLIAGSYPAFYLSSFNPVWVLKGLKLKSGSAGVIRKGLVILQFSVSVILIISTIIIYRQIQHVKNRDLGYNKQGLIYTYLNGNMKNNFPVIKNDLIQTGIVQNACLSTNRVLELGSNTGDFQWEGKDPNKQVLITIVGVSPEYISTMGMQLVQGRDFNKDIKSDSNNIIINETLARMLGKSDVVGSLVTRNNGMEKYTIVGVIKNFIYNSMYSPAAPLIMYSDTSGANVLSVRFTQNADIKTALAKTESIIKKDNPGYPVEFSFVDAEFNQLFKTESLIGKLAGVFATLAIFISCLGLFGLSAYLAEKRTKEIGIRKVLGASASGLAGLLSKDFIRLVIISCVIAFPISWWIMHNWLQGFEYHIRISWWIFLMAGLMACVIALITVSFQAIKTAVVNPVESLRAE